MRCQDFFRSCAVDETIIPGLIQPMGLPRPAFLGSAYSPGLVPGATLRIQNIGPLPPEQDRDMRHASGSVAIEGFWSPFEGGRGMTKP